MGGERPVRLRRAFVVTAGPRVWRFPFTRESRGRVYKRVKAFVQRLAAAGVPLTLEETWAPCRGRK